MGDNVNGSQQVERPQISNDGPPATPPKARLSDVSSYSPATSLNATPKASNLTPKAVLSTNTNHTPDRRRPKPPTKGILKPPPPPAKPTLGNRLRDMVVGSVTAVGGGARGLFEPADQQEGSNGQPGADGSVGPSNMPAGAVVGTLNAISGRLGFGLSRLVAGQQMSSGSASSSTNSLRSLSVNEPPHLASPAPTPDQVRQKQPLKRATFVLPSLSITYPISSQGEPWSRKVVEDRERVESNHRSLLLTAKGSEYWTAHRLVTLYESACRGREEKPRVAIARALQALPPSPRPRVIHLVLADPQLSSPTHPAPFALEHPFTRHSAETFADILTIEWSLSDLRLERGLIESDDSLKPILHALLISGTLPSLSLAGNKKIRSSGWRLLAIFLKRARSLKFIDLSDTTWDRKGIDYLVQALNYTHVQPHATSQEDSSQVGDSQPSTTDLESQKEDEVDGTHSLYVAPSAPLLKGVDEKNVPAAVQTVRMDGCGLRTSTLEALAHGVRSSDLTAISLRRNKIGPLGAVALALMIRDYPDAVTHLNGGLAPLSTSSTDSNSYSPRPRRPISDLSDGADDANLPPIPLVVSSSTGGVTSRVVPEGYKPPPLPKHPLVMPGGGYSAMQDGGGFSLSSTIVEGKMTAPEFGGASLALQRSVRALDGVERIGRLVTLDLKSNEIRSGVGYIAQVLKRNRTLKVLNLSDNRIEPAGLASLAEALKYNSTLETLDLSSNPCAGPGQDGIAALRTSFTVNTSLKRLFLSDIGLTTDGAIALAEFIPENRSLLHLDLTSNSAIDTAGILAVSSGLKSNKIIRCLDISIPPNNPELAELSQSILQSCIRNTELAVTSSAREGKPARSGQEAIWGPIKKSSLVRQVKEADAARAQKEREDLAKSVEGVAREYVYILKPHLLGTAAAETVHSLEQWFEAGRIARARSNVAWEPGQLPKEDFRPLVERARALCERIAERVQEMSEPDELESLLGLNDSLTSLVDRARGFMPPPRTIASQIIPTSAAQSPTPSQTMQPPQGGRRSHRRGPSVEISSPNFSIGESDAESDAEELDAKNLGPQAELQRPLLGIVAELQDIHIGEENHFVDDDNGMFMKESRHIDPERAASADRLVADELAQGLDLCSPVDRVSRAWVEEEAEIFRKGTRLGVIDDEEGESGGRGDVSGEQLRQEILDTEVPRSPPRQVVEESEQSDINEEVEV